MPYKAKGKCVYNTDTGEKVGCTDGSVKKYLAALYANVPDAKNEETTKPMKKIKLSEIARKVIKENKSGPIMLNGKEVDVSSIELDNVNITDYPDFSDAYITAANYADGTPVADTDLQKLESENYGLVNQLAHDQRL